MNKATNVTYSPTVFFIDDDYAVRRRVRRMFHKETSVGIVTSGNLKEAREMLADKEIHFDAILADILFDSGLNDPEHDLYDGIDFLRLSDTIRPNVSKYIISCFSDSEAEHLKSRQSNLDIIDWFPKLSFGMRPDLNAPWIKIERDLFTKTLAQDKTLKERLKKMNIDIKVENNIDLLSEQVRATIHPPIRTYLQELNGTHLQELNGVYIIKHPIEVFCIVTENTVTANAIHLGLLQEGIGDDVDEALDDLSVIIVEQLLMFENESDESTIGYAKLVKNRLGEYIVKKS